MPKKKAAAKKKKTSSKKTVKRTSRKKPVAKKSAKKSASRKKTAKKGSSKKKPAKKKVAKKAAKKKKAAVSKKKVTKKKATKKKAAKKRPAAKKKPAKKPAGRKTAVKKKAAGKARTARRMDILTSPSAAAGPYKPRRGESYMNSGQLEHFRLLLTNWKKELMEEVDRTMLHMKDEAANFPDPNDRATQESEFGLELRTRDRERKLLRKIDSALQRIDDGSYGYCDETGEEIGLRRLEARPVATLCVEAQERRELAERQYRDRDDQYR
jgi:DnaK suppressor protein